MTNQKIKDLPEIERPREKLMRYGPGKLSNSELLAILLRSGQRGENVVNLAEKILKNFSSKNLASNIIVAHNHPSGHIEPSKEDILLTKQLVKAGKILGIEVTDHVILSKEGYLSFKEKKLL
jgi:DNA repair protein RadC